MFQDYCFYVTYESQQLRFYGMGQETEWLYDKTCEAYNEAVLLAFGVSGEALVNKSCRYRITEKGLLHQGTAVVRLYEECLCVLPPNEYGRRFPLCFVEQAGVKDYTYELKLSTGEEVVLSMMGSALDYLDHMMDTKLRQLWEKTEKWHRFLAPSVGKDVAESVSAMPFGRGANLRNLGVSVPSLADALETKLSNSRIAQSYEWLCSWSGGKDLQVGALPSSQEDEEENAAPILWVIAHDDTCQKAAVELALAEDEAAATYVYRLDGEWEIFALWADRALEATGFDRQLIYQSKEQLMKPENARRYMLVQRTPAVDFMRERFMGRTIHSTRERWQQDMNKY